MKKIDNEWRIPIMNLNCPCYATVNAETGETNCMKNIPFGTGIISESRALKKANQLLKDKCNSTFTKIERTWITRTFVYHYLPGANKEDVCHGITKYLSDYSDIWMAEKTLIAEGPVCDTSIPEAQCTKGKLISAIVLVGLEGNFVCGYAINHNAPLETKILFLDEVCESKMKEVIDDTYKIHLKSRQFVPEPEISNALKSTASPKQMHVLLQFYHIPNNDERLELSNLNVTLCGYIHNNAYFASISTKYLTEIFNLSFIRWIGEILPEDKISSRIQEDKIGNWAINEDRTINITVKYFKDVPSEDVKNIIKKYKGIVKSEAGILNDITVSISKDRIAELANEDAVQWIKQVPSLETTLVESE